MGKKLIYLSLLIILLTGSFVSAGFGIDNENIPVLGTFKQNECVELIQTCSDCTYVNFTRVSYPDGTQALGNVEATKTGSVFNYTFCNTSILGKYVVQGIGDVEATDTVFAYSFKITKLGVDTTTGEGIIYVVSSFFIFLLFLLSLYFAITIPFEDQRNPDGSLMYVDYKKYLKFVMAFVSYLTLMFFMFIGKGMSTHLGTNELYSFFSVVSSIMVAIVAPLLMASITFVIISVLADKKIQKQVERGLPVR